MTEYQARARYYDEEYAFSEDACLLASLVTSNVHTILEIPSGSGRNLWLTETGRKIVFADREPEMVRILSEKLVSMDRNSSVRIIQADLCNLDLKECFDLILIPHDAFLMLTRDEEIETALQGLRRHLSPSGRLMIDTAFLGSVQADPKGLPTCYDPHLPDGEWKLDLERPLNRGIRLLREKRQCRISELLYFDFSYRIMRGDEQIETYTAAVTLRCHSAGGLEDLITSAGLTIVGCFGGYDQRPFRPNDSRAIYLLERAG